MGHIAMGRFATTEDPIGTLPLLASEADALIAGQTVCVDGGRNLEGAPPPGVSRSRPPRCP